MNSVQNIPRVSVLLPVHNGEPYLREAVESVLNQTFPDFELVVINDGSTDRTGEILETYSDPRIRRLNNPQCLGLIKTLNRGLREVRGEYIARMDADDICLPRRLAIQLRYMDRHPQVGVLGGQVIGFGKEAQGRSRRYTDHDDIVANMIFYASIHHPTVMMRTALLRKYHLAYDEAYAHCEDRDLWVRAAQCFKLANLDQVVLYYRKHGGSVSWRHYETQRRNGDRVIRRILEGLGLNPTEAELKLHRAHLPFENITPENFLAAQEAWLSRLLFQNRKLNRFNRKSLEKIVHQRWYSLCLTNSAGVPGLMFQYARSSLARGPVRCKAFNLLKLFSRSMVKSLRPENVP